MRRVRQSSALILLLLLTACAARSGPPPSLGPRGQTAWYAQRLVLAFESVQVGVIGLNKIERCLTAPGFPEAPKPPAQACSPLLPTETTRAVLKIIDATVDVIAVAPDGGRSTATAALAQIRGLLGMRGQQEAAAWLQLVELVLKEPLLR